MPNKNRIDYVVVMSCGHSNAFPASNMPRATDFLWCRRCQQYQDLSHVVGQYRSLCLVRDCDYHRFHGSAQRAAQQAAQQHANKHPEHVTAVLLGTERVRLYGASAEQLELFKVSA